MKWLKIVIARLPNSATHRQKTLTDKGTLLCVLKYFKSNETCLLSHFSEKKSFLNLLALWWNFPCQLYCIGFCISQVKLCISGSHIFKDTWQDTRNTLLGSQFNLLYSLKIFGIIIWINISIKKLTSNCFNFLLKSSQGLRLFKLF